MICSSVAQILFVTCIKISSLLPINLNPAFVSHYNGAVCVSNAWQHLHHRLPQKKRVKDLGSLLQQVASKGGKCCNFLCTVPEWLTTRITYTLYCPWMQCIRAATDRRLMLICTQRSFLSVKLTIRNTRFLGYCMNMQETPPRERRGVSNSLVTVWVGRLDVCVVVLFSVSGSCLNG